MEDYEIIEVDSAEEKRSGYPDLPPKAPEFSAVSDDFYQHRSNGRYLFGAIVPVQWQWTMDGGTGTQHLAEHIWHQ